MPAMDYNWHTGHSSSRLFDYDPSDQPKGLGTGRATHAQQLALDVFAAIVDVCWITEGANRKR